MNRRAFLSSITAGFLMPRLAQTSRTPESPDLLARPAPVDLGEGIILVDYRIYPGERPAIIGEIRSDRDEMIDAPVMSLSWPDDVFTWAPPIIPIIEPGGSVPIFGPLPETGEAQTLVDTARFALCSPVEAGKSVRAHQALDLDFRVKYERHRAHAFKGTGIVRNIGTTLAMQVAIRGIVRDAGQRIAGMTTTSFFPSIRPDAQKEFNLWIGTTASNKANPVPLISGLDYSVDVRVGTIGSPVAQGCSLGQPWE